jgi:adenosylcobinamide kinase/adenosylcobinamide-phosphate guanylyltransferase
MTSRRILVTGGVRSGKSRYAEGLLADEPRVSYLAPGPVPDPTADPEWAARIAEHQARRPARWVTVETTDVAEALRRTEPPVLLDCLGTWLTAVLDELGAWDGPPAQWRPAFEARLADLLDAWRTSSGLVVAVTNEVGWGLVSEHRSGRIFADLLGRVNAEVAAASEELVLVVAGRALRL